MDIFQNQCSESLGFDSMLSANHLNSPLHDSPGSPNPLNFAPSSPYFASISQQLASGHTSGPNDVILPSIFVKIPTQINQQYQQETRLRSHHSTSNEIKSEERSEPIKSEIADTRVKLTSVNSTERLPDVIDSYLNDTLDVGTQPETPILLCECCPFATLSETRLNDHRRERHPARVTTPADKLACPVCENKFYKKSVLKLHLSDDHEMLPSEVEAVCNRAAANPTQQQPNMIDGPCSDVPPTARNETNATTNQIPASSAAPPAQNKSRIYIKNVQLLKKPDVIAQETRQENVSQQGQQQLLSTEQEPSAIAHGTLQDAHQLTLGDDILQHDQALDLPHNASQPAGSNGNKIFIRNVSLLQNVNFVPSAENILTNGSSKYNAPSYMSMDCANDPLNNGYSLAQSTPTTSQSSRGSRIYIKNVDILRNPLISSLNEPVPSSNAATHTTAFNEPITSRASSCESIICTSTPPASMEQPVVPEPSLSTTNASLSQLVPTPCDQSLLNGTEVSYTIGSTMENAPRTLPLTVDQGSPNLLMLFSTTLDGGGTGAEESSVSYLTDATNGTNNLPNALMGTTEYDTHLATTTPAASSCDAQQQPQQRKSKIFIKNISVLKQPTIHLKSVDEVNLMTYDELQLQNMLPSVAVPQGSIGGGGGGGGSSITTATLVQNQEGHDSELMGSTERMDKPFGEIIELDCQSHPAQDDAMDGYHESDLGYGELGEVCDFTEGFNDRDDPGGGGLVVDTDVSVTGNESNTNGNMIGEPTHCETIATGYTNDIILLQEESDTNCKITPNHDWASIGTGESCLVQDILQVPLDGNAEMPDDTDAATVCPRREEDMLFATTEPQQVINLDPPGEFPTVNDGEAAFAASVAEQPLADQQVMIVSDGLTPSEEEPVVPIGAARESERPRTRGRPKGAKQTGITKLKKLYSNLTAEEEGYKCELLECGVRFRQADRLEYHRKCHVPGDTASAIRCPECGSLEFRNWNTLHTHLWREHEIDMELYACHLCSFKTPVLCRLNNTHMKIHSEERNFKCAICGKAFKNNKQLRNHRRWHREPQQQQLQQSDVPLPVDVRPKQPEQPVDTPVPTAPPTDEPSDKQKATKTPQLTMKCVKCGVRFAGKRQLRAHMDAKHPTEAGEQMAECSASKHRCLLCGMVFRTRYLLQAHAAKHSDEKRFKCEHCEYTTNDHNAFRRHKMRHSTKGGHMYKCSYCDYSSIQSTTYRKHLERMHAEVASALLYKCAKCPFVSISETKYQLHRTKHEPDGTDERQQEPNTKVIEPPVEEHRTVEECDSDQQQRQCESVNSDVVIVEQREPSLIGAPLMELEPTGSIQIIQHPIIRPAMFANNFSKVDNFYGYQPHQHDQSMIVKLAAGSTPLRGMCPLQVSAGVPVVGTVPAATIVPVVPVHQLPEQQQQQQQQQQQHQYVHLASATDDVIMRELN